jgi:hypothetical protein
MRDVVVKAGSEYPSQISAATATHSSDMISFSMSVKPLVAGWNSSPSKLLDFLRSEGVATNACVCFFDWSAAANPGGLALTEAAMAAWIGLLGDGQWPVFPGNLGQTYRNAQQEGDRLYQWLKGLIDSGQISPHDITLVGHSFGGVANGIAADRIYRETGQKIGEMVVIDTPQLPFLPATSWINPNSAEKVIVIYGGIMNGAVGGPIGGANVVNVGMDLSSRGVWLDLFHPGHLRLPEYWPGLSGQIRGLLPGNYHEVWAGGTSTFLPGHPAYHYGEGVIWSGPVIRVWPPRMFTELAYSIGYGCRLVEDGNDLPALLENPAGGSAQFAQVYRSVVLPTNAHYMEFQYRVASPGESGDLRVSFGDQLLYTTSVRNTNDACVSSGKFYVGDLAGMTNVLAVSLLATNSQGNTSVLIKDPVFYYAGTNGSLLEPPETIRITGFTVNTNATEVTLAWTSIPTHLHSIDIAHCGDDFDLAPNRVGCFGARHRAPGRRARAPRV